MVYILPLCMIFISILFFRDLGLKRVLIFNGVFMGLYLLPSLHVPYTVCLALQGITGVAYFTVAKTA